MQRQNRKVLSTHRPGLLTVGVLNQTRTQKTRFMAVAITQIPGCVLKYSPPPASVQLKRSS